MRLRQFLTGRYRDVVFMTDSGLDPANQSWARCEVFEQLCQQASSVDKLKAQLQYAVDDPEGLVALSHKVHVCHQARIRGVEVKFKGIDVGRYRLYGFEHGGRLVILTTFSMKKTQKTSKADKSHMERRCEEYLLALERRARIVVDA